MERSTQPKRRSCPTRSRLERSAVQSLVYRRAPDRQSNPIAPRGLVQSIVFAGLGNSALGYRQDATRALRIQSSSLCSAEHKGEPLLGAIERRGLDSGGAHGGIQHLPPRAPLQNLTLS